MKVAVVTSAAPSVEESVKLGQALKADAIITGVVKEYGEVRSGTTTANVVSVSIQMIETATAGWSGPRVHQGRNHRDRAAVRRGRTAGEPRDRGSGS